MCLKCDPAAVCRRERARPDRRGNHSCCNAFRDRGAGSVQLGEACTLEWSMRWTSNCRSCSWILEWRDPRDHVRVTGRLSSGNRRASSQREFPEEAACMGRVHRAAVNRVGVGWIAFDASPIDDVASHDKMSCDVDRSAAMSVWMCPAIRRKATMAVHHRVESLRMVRRQVAGRP